MREESKFFLCPHSLRYERVRAFMQVMARESVIKNLHGWMKLKRSSSAAAAAVVAGLLFGSLEN